MLRHCKELLIYREMLLTWSKRDLKVRYKQSFLGAAWAVLQPLSATIIFTLVFSRFVPVPLKKLTDRRNVTHYLGHVKEPPHSPVARQNDLLHTWVRLAVGPDG